MLRIIGGAYKGRRLKLVRGPETRPMQDKVKGALFNILGDLVSGTVCLDGFAGTGSVGLEALSRGAARAVFVEESPAAVKVLRQNIARCGAEDKAVVMAREFNRAVIQLAKEKVGFDLVFLDPPYRLLEERNPLKVVCKRRVLKPGGLLVLRRHYRVKPAFKEFRLEREVTLGDDVLAFFVNPDLVASGGLG
ncbi:MAG: 16S rRNA (guanine(966)-N(2))-methyltransferase RsmD [Candidatus Aminicenantes bacterium]|nr:16S rRNA (guanine(966)-N(2))-methyltransferase RsmD [Candidatus Aminicenantes bacterium]